MDCYSKLALFAILMNFGKPVCHIADITSYLMICRYCLSISYKEIVQLHKTWFILIAQLLHNKLDNSIWFRLKNILKGNESSSALTTY